MAAVAASLSGKAAAHPEKPGPTPPASDATGAASGRDDDPRKPHPPAQVPPVVAAASALNRPAPNLQPAGAPAAPAASAIAAASAAPATAAVSGPASAPGASGLPSGVAARAAAGPGPTMDPARPAEGPARADAAAPTPGPGPVPSAPAGGPVARLQAAVHSVVTALRSPMAAPPGLAPAPTALEAPRPGEVGPPPDSWQLPGSGSQSAWQLPESGQQGALPTFSFTASLATVPVAVAAGAVDRPPPVDREALQSLGLQMQGALGPDASAPAVIPPASAAFVQGDASQTSSGGASTRGDDAGGDSPTPERWASAPAGEAGALAAASSLLRPDSALPAATRAATTTLHDLARDLPRALADAWEQRRPADAPETAVELRMDPPSLGSVSVRLVEQNGLVHAHVTAAHPEVGHALHRELSNLTQRLAQHGIALGSVTVGTGQNPSHSGSQPSLAEWEPAAAVPVRSGGGPDPPRSVGLRPSAAVATGRVNVRA